MFRQFLLISMAAALTASCATPPREPELTSDIVVIEEAQREDYWVTRQDGVYVKVSGRRIPSGCGRVVLRYVIDSRGDVYNAEVLESEPPGGFDKAALAQLAEWDYVPAESNPGRIPVQVTSTVNFTDQKSDC
ncbi:energy transducer TonB [Marinihelvus fidelis]|uniref:Energy transducer TonB n=1 Tax=Marinihelvus fidelis TaxID=2613842 RepID=A0A5N0TB32_9GAMM|nr:energy transducer TonB [Marinihelvus fidelis]KAA9131357.1 energy transducer TonB [Marinihelvus fidelis]